MEEIKSIGISFELTLNLHALNNEERRGNITIPKTGYIIADKQQYLVQVISGGIIRHGIETYLRNTNISKCKGCKKSSSSRCSEDDEIINNKLAIERCGICDIMGYMRTEGEVKEQNKEKNKNKQQDNKTKQQDNKTKQQDEENPNKEESQKNFNRTSIMNVADALQIPHYSFTTGEYQLRIRRVDNAGSREDDKSRNLDQSIINIPSNSGVYAFVIFIDVDQLGKHEYSEDYFISSGERKSRLLCLIDSIYSFIMNPIGSHASSHLPNSQIGRGVITVSKNHIPATIETPLEKNFNEIIKNIAEKIKQPYFEFNGKEECFKKFQELKEKINKTEFTGKEIEEEQNVDNI